MGDISGLRHILLPDDYWNMSKAEGGIGGVLLVQHGIPQVFSCMIPDYLAAQLLATKAVQRKKFATIALFEEAAVMQGNTPAELLAIWWHSSHTGGYSERASCWWSRIPSARKATCKLERRQAKTASTW